MDEYGILKLIDFGFSQKFQINGYGKYNKFYGTSGYMAPEISKNTFFNIKQADLFALGVILFIMVYGSPPFIKAHESDEHYEIM